MMKSELFSWPVTLVILALAFGSLVAASLPLMLTIVGLIASAGVLYLGTLLADISIWSMNFALMFALALGIDYALFIVVRYRAAHFGHGLSPGRRRGRRHGHRGQGRALQRHHRADLALGRHARAEPGVPLDGARHHDLGRLHPRRDAHAAAGRARRARAEGRQPLAQVGPLGRAPLAVLRPLGRAHLGKAAALRRSRAARPARPRRPGARPEDRHAVDQGRPDQRQLAHRLHPGTGRVRPRSAGRAAARRSRIRGRGARPDGQARRRHRRRHADPDLEPTAATRSCRRSRARTRPTPPSAAPSTGFASTLPAGRSSAARRPRTTTSRRRSRTRPRS